MNDLITLVFRKQLREKRITPGLKSSSFCLCLVVFLPLSPVGVDSTASSYGRKVPFIAGTLPFQLKHSTHACLVFVLLITNDTFLIETINNIWKWTHLNFLKNMREKRRKCQYDSTSFIFWKIWLFCAFGCLAVCLLYILTQITWDNSVNFLQDFDSKFCFRYPFWTFINSA